MIDTRYTVLHKVPVLILVALLTTYLVRVTLNAAHADTSSSYAAAYTYPLDNFKVAMHNISTSVDNFSRDTTRSINNDMHSIARAPGHVVHFASSVADIPAFIKPADTERKDVPVIKPLHFAPVELVSAPTSQPVVAAAPAPTPAAPVSQVIAAPATPKYEPATSNLYTWGNCTWWTAIRRAQVGDSIPNTWGNAATWARRAAADGYVVDHHPTPGSIMQNSSMAGGLGHVAFVESVAPDGSWRISEMNVLGLDRIDYATNPSSAAAYYYFIHDRL